MPLPRVTSREEFVADRGRMEVIANRRGPDSADFNKVLTDDSLGGNVY